MTTYLTRILEFKSGEVAELKKSSPERLYREKAADLLPARDFYGALRRAPESPVNLIAEVKKASPSRGVLVEHFHPADIARRYAGLGASAFSVLTDREFFQGSNDYLQQVASSCDLPVLRKDFIIDQSQIFEARLIGADAILLIVAALEPRQLGEYLSLAHDLGLGVLVEVHDEHELEQAVEQGACMIGVNNRDLRDFTVSLETSIRLRPLMPSGIIAVAESGLKRASDVMLMQEALFDAVLIGEGLLGEELQGFTWKRI